VPERIVKETSGAEEVQVVALLLADRHVRDELSFALKIERQRFHVNVFAVTRQDIGQRYGHVQTIDVNLEILPRLGILVVEYRL
jgi:hypothetical protein